ncbi:hypothetical protein A0O34_03410 [Chryseobacterium glaciei]|uniref:Uncharacterized protein n=1 Tax=Chryseobacterium glaciei TaxID=1685010 RepID=A0A172XRN6_9FLAO|nr:T9SS type A sorting domain-containing protein [Chryseobacterium glaciei]ANF49648.1 hypothetical protein A0O34_03410 [Chryseobacterium glaciei]
MKKIYLIVFMILFSGLKAQIVNIPDIHFKNVLLTTTYPVAMGINGYIDIDSNNDGEIQKSEADKVLEIHVNMPMSWNPIMNEISAIASLQGIKEFVNLRSVYISGLPSLSSIDLSNLTDLYNIIIEDNNTLTSINVQGCTSLTDVRASNMNLSSLLLQNCTQLKRLNCSNAKLQTLDVSSNTLLESLNASTNQLTTIDLSGLTALYDGYLTWNNLTSITFNNNTALIWLNLINNKLPSISFAQAPNIKLLSLSINKFTNLDVSGLTQLQGIDCAYNLLTSLDLSHNTKIQNFSCDYNPNLQSLFIKNGINNFTQNSPSSLSNNPSLAFICADDFEILNATNLLPANTNCVVNSYCSFTPGGTFYTVEGNTKYDSNNNGCDTNDPNKAFQKFNITNGSISGSVIANNSGNYSIPLQAGTHTITPILENPTYFNFSPTSIIANFPTQTSPFNQNFCMSANGSHNDLEVLIFPIAAAVPGFDAKYKIIYKNKGTTTQSGAFAFNYNDDLMNYLNSTVSPNSQSTGVLNWNFTNLLPFETREITVTFTLNTPTQTPALNGGDILHYTAQINAGTDETPLDNTFTLNQTVVNSFDPNDKTCLEGASITQAQVRDYVHYLIRFENNGTANAQNIVVKDVIDTSKFDISSLVSLNGSHNFVTRITNPNTVEFIFENIQLPFNNANNDGYISFKIKTKSTLNLGDSFSNKANIYFDYNHPIITNNYTTTVQNVLATSEINNDKTQFSIYPNPVKDVLFIKSKEKIVKAEIYDVAGRILNSASVTDNSVNVSELSKGNYIIKLSTKDKTMTQKFIKN